MGERYVPEAAVEPCWVGGAPPNWEGRTGGVGVEGAPDGACAPAEADGSGGCPAGPGTRATGVGVTGER